MVYSYDTDEYARSINNHHLTNLSVTLPSYSFVVEMLKEEDAKYRMTKNNLQPATYISITALLIAVTTAAFVIYIHFSEKPKGYERDIIDKLAERTESLDVLAGILKEVVIHMSVPVCQTKY